MSPSAEHCKQHSAYEHDKRRRNGLWKWPTERPTMLNWECEAITVIHVSLSALNTRHVIEQACCNNNPCWITFETWNGKNSNRMLTLSGSTSMSSSLPIRYRQFTALFRLLIWFPDSSHSILPSFARTVSLNNCACAPTLQPCLSQTTLQSRLTITS